jgi:hypothetical protein
MIQQFKYLVITVFCIISSINNSFSQAISVGFVSVMTTDQKSIQISVIKTDEINASKFIYYRADNNSNIYKEIGRGANTFTDKNVDANKEAYCYKVSYLDNFGKESEMSQPFCSVFLSSDGMNTIKWTAFSELANAEPVEYYIDLVNEDGSINYNRAAKILFLREIAFMPLTLIGISIHEFERSNSEDRSVWLPMIDNWVPSTAVAIRRAMSLRLVTK